MIKKAEHILLFRYIITHLLILSIPMGISILYYLSSKRSQEISINKIVQTQLDSDSGYIEQKLRDVNKQIESLLVDYELNRYLNLGSKMTDIDIYNTKRISARLSSLVSGGEFFSRSFIYMDKSDLVIIDNGTAPYKSFYRDMFHVIGFNQYTWKDFMEQEETPLLLHGFYTSKGSGHQYSHLLINRIGKGKFYRGSLVSVLDSEEIAKRMTRLPELYGGWLIILDDSGTLISSTGSFEQGLELAKHYMESGEQKSLTIDDRQYRLFHRKNQSSQWQYIAFMDESYIYRDLVKIRNKTLILLSVGFFISLVISLILAYFNYQPIEKLFRKMKLPPQSARIHYSGLFLNLERKVEMASAATRLYFLQNLLRGKYRNRKIYDRDRREFEILFKDGKYCVLVIRLSSLALSVDSLNTGDVLSSLMDQFKLFTEEGEFVLRASSGEIAVILSPDENDFRRRPLKFINQLTEELEPKLKEHILFGIGSPAEDSFLLPLSFNEAEAACHYINENTRSLICFYTDIPVPNSSYDYPLHTEEAILRAVKALNTELLLSIKNRIITANFIEKKLGLQEKENLVRAVTGTAYRIIANIPIKESPALRYKINTICETETPEKAVTGLFDFFQQMAEREEKGCNKHKSRIIEEIKNYIEKKYPDSNMGISMIADQFNLSENYLSTLFKENEGVKLSAYILKIRMDKAIDLLANHPELSIDTISGKCGYPNTSSFRRAFRRLFNQAPSEFRKRS